MSPRYRELRRYGTQDVHHVLDALYRIQRMKGKSEGICELLYQLSPMTAREAEFFLRLYAASWPLNSGQHNYPVPSGDPEISPLVAYYHMPRWTGRYGQLRQQLLQHLINELEADIKEYN